mgnify:FL=1
MSQYSWIQCWGLGEILSKYGKQIINNCLLSVLLLNFSSYTNGVQETLWMKSCRSNRFTFHRTDTLSKPLMYFLCTDGTFIILNASEAWQCASRQSAAQWYWLNSYYHNNRLSSVMCRNILFTKVHLVLNSDVLVR